MLFLWGDMMKVKLGDIGAILTGNTPKTSDGKNYISKDINFIKPSDIDEDKITNISTSDYFISELAKNDARILPVGSILVTCIGIIGKVGINSIECAFNQQINAIIPDTRKCNNKFLAYAIQFKKNELQQLANAPVVPILNKTQFSNIQICLPLIEKQNKIVKILDKLNEIINKRQQQLKKLDELVKSRFIEMFGDPLKNTLKWKIKKLKLIAPANEFTGDIESNNEKYWLLQLDMIESNTGKILSKYFVSLDKIGVSTIKFSKDNVLYSKLRPYLNKVVLPDEAGFATSEMIPLFPTEELNKIFLAFVLRDDGIVRFLNAHVSGSKMPRVQADVFWNLGIILPPSTLQNQFADFVEQTDKSKLEIQKSLDKLEILKKSLMQQYFD